MQTAAAIRETYPHWLRWLAPYLMHGPKLAWANRRRAAQVISPIMEKRMAGKGDGTGHGDGIQWLLAAGGTRRKKSALELADEQLFLAIASINSTSASIIFHPPRSGRSSRGPRRHRQGAGSVTITRSAVRPYTFKDGFHLPAHTLISFPMAKLNRDPTDLWPDGSRFDGSGNKAATPMRGSSPFFGGHSINFRTGITSAQEIKLMLAHLLLKYEIGWPEGRSRPRNMA
ncbi:MAG: hypothetical protein Q9207_007803 [Kuettlingeria erythrocarpa]